MRAALKNYLNRSSWVPHVSRFLRDVGLPQMSAIEGYVLEDGVRRRT